MEREQRNKVNGHDFHKTKEKKLHLCGPVVTNGPKKRTHPHHNNNKKKTH